MVKVFVAGCGRSGTSYLRTIIDAHPDVFIPNECLFLVDYLKYASYVPRPILNWLFFHEPQLRCFYEREKFEFDDIRSAISRVHEVEAREHGAKIWGHKVPRFIRYLDIFDANFEDIRWILIYRDPRAVAASMKQSSQHTHSMVRVCKRWKNDNRNIVEMLRGEIRKSNILLIKYEDLILEYEKSLESIFQFLGIDSIGPDEINQRGRPVFFKRSRFKINTVRGSLTPNAEMLTPWENSLSHKELAYIEQTCADEMAEMGYEPVLPPSSAKESGFLIAGLMDVSIFFQYLVKWPEYLFMTSVRTLIFESCHFWHKSVLRRDV